MKKYQIINEELEILYKIIELPEIVGKTLEEVEKYLDEKYPITPNVWQSLKLR